MTWPLHVCTSWGNAAAAVGRTARAAVKRQLQSAFSPLSYTFNIKPEVRTGRLDGVGDETGGHGVYGMSGGLTESALRPSTRERSTRADPILLTLAIILSLRLLS